MQKPALEICVRKTLSNDSECSKCNGYPLEKGCIRYVTKEHLQNFDRMFGIDPPRSYEPEPTPSWKALDDFEQAGGFYN